MIAVSVAWRTVGFICLSWSIASLVTAALWHHVLRQHFTEPPTPPAPRSTIDPADIDDINRRFAVIDAEHAAAKRAHPSAQEPT